MVNPIKETPLKITTLDTDGFKVEELPYINKINLRGDFESQACNAALTGLLGTDDCQLETNTYMHNNANTLFWLGPDERLLYTNSDPGSVIEKWCSMPGTAAVDLSDYYTVLKLSGSKVRDVIASGTPFDVHPSQFRVGQCTQTRYGSATVLMSNHADTPVFQLQVRWSYAKYVFGYLERVSNYV